MKLAKMFNHNFNNGTFKIFDKNGNVIYSESKRYPRKIYKLNDKGLIIFCNYSNGKWYKIGYDENDNKTYFENSDGYWNQKEYDENNNEVFYKSSDGFWSIRDYDENGNQVYYENSNGKVIPTQNKCQKIIFIDGKKYKLTKI